MKPIFHSPLRFYPKDTDLIVITIGVTRDHAALFCGFTADGCEQGPAYDTHAAIDRLERGTDLACFKRIDCRDRIVLASAARPEPIGDHRDWDAAYTGFHVENPDTLIQHELVLALAGDQATVSGQYRRRTYNRCDAWAPSIETYHADGLDRVGQLAQMSIDQATASGDLGVAIVALQAVCQTSRATLLAELREQRRTRVPRIRLPVTENAQLSF